MSSGTHRRILLGLSFAALTLTGFGCGDILQDAPPSNTGESPENSRQQTVSKTDREGSDTPNVDQPRDMSLPEPKHTADYRLKPEYDHLDQSDLELYSNNWADKQEYIIAPWAHRIDDTVAAEAEVTDDTIRFPLQYASKLERIDRLDVIASANLDNLFMKRVTGIRTSDDQLIFDVDQATMGDAMLKARIRTEDFKHLGQKPGGMQTRRQKLGDGLAGEALEGMRNIDSLENEYVTLTLGGDIGLGSYDFQTPKGLAAGEFTEGELEIGGNITGAPVAEVNHRFLGNFDFAWQRSNRQPGQDLSGPGQSFFWSSRECGTIENGDPTSWDAADWDHTKCFGVENPADRFDDNTERCSPFKASYTDDVASGVAEQLEVGKAYCVYPFEDGDVSMREQTQQGWATREEGDDTWITQPVDRDEYETCGDVLRTLQWAKEDAKWANQCQQAWSRWYQSSGNNGARLPYACTGTTWDAFAPVPAQTEWAKMACTGQGKLVEFDYIKDEIMGIENFDADFDVTVGTDPPDPFAEYATATYPLLPKTPISSPSLYFFVGWWPNVFVFPIKTAITTLIGVTGDIDVHGTGPGKDWVEETVHASGFHYYGTPEAYERGHFGPDSAPPETSDYYDWAHKNRSLSETEESGLDVKDSGAAAQLHLTPEVQVSALYYGAVGPKITGAITNTVIVQPFRVGEDCSVTLEGQFEIGIGIDTSLPSDIPIDSDWLKSPRDLVGDNIAGKFLSAEPSVQVYNTCDGLNSGFFGVWDKWDFTNPENNIPEDDGDDIPLGCPTDSDFVNTKGCQRRCISPVTGACCPDPDNPDSGACFQNHESTNRGSNSSTFTPLDPDEVAIEDKSSETVSPSSNTVPVDNLEVEPQADQQVNEVGSSTNTSGGCSTVGDGRMPFGLSFILSICLLMVVRTRRAG